ncbi:hypothetical protein LAZ67_2006268 [Cordylochernes scorpioides]|uniref:Uncharacterized protein n=1 Tax=Cordylochernes scorpioides TaxID=51811 RepID=A0ABY6K9Q4_9ARAC|nr:hypothetical protein LAZ67_2006268 [Cordylochernes scorpioides]
MSDHIQPTYHKPSFKMLTTFPGPHVQNFPQLSMYEHDGKENSAIFTAEVLSMEQKFQVFLLHGMWGEGAIAPLVSHISEFPVHGYRSGSGLTTPYFTLQDSPLLVLLISPTT